ncbi:MAG TPA: D-alanyl-D-alanine carboxypeptidase family protein [Dongiaceae bacterium]
MALARISILAIVIAGLVGAAPASRAASVVVDAKTGAILSADSANHLWYPASLTKMMTVYVALTDIGAGRLSFADKITVSAAAANVAPVRFGLSAGQVITVRQAIDAAIVASGNDAATALAEKIGGTEQKFADMMTLAARGLGMTRSVFRNATGLPDDRQVTTAHDMALLAMALLKTYPQHYALFNQRSVTINGKRRGTVNGILGSYEGADGFKTGFTCGAGYNLVASAMRGDRRIIGVVLGSASRGERKSVITRLLDKAFARAASKDVPLAEPVMAATDEGAPPTVLSGKICVAQGDGESLVEATARAGGWGIVFGSFADKAKAVATLKEARKKLGSIAGSGKGTVAPKRYNGVTQWSAMILGLTKGVAGKACKTLWTKNAYCLALRPDVLSNKSMAWR